MLSKVFATIAVVITGGILLYGVSDFPGFGDPHSPANAGVPGQASISQYFITESYGDTKVPNIVTSVLADYRGYDTMFETVVIFAAGMAIFAILRVVGDDSERKPRRKQESSFTNGDHSRIIIGTTCRLLVPVIQLFALYVIAHGHHSPGGGFQGGVILAASFIIIALAENLNSALKRLSETNYLKIACIGILIYAGFGVMCQVLESDFLDYGVLQPILMTDGPEMARSHSMLGVEIGVAFTVTAIMFAIYANLSSRGLLRDGL
ncbi:MAG: MnhB domain-containing protein [Verrucomicrobiales bacterium]|nr:MnhB domain-containing protein [Verrucomicrobiales bacterium]